MKKCILIIFLWNCFFTFAQHTEYYRQLRYNHVSPIIDIAGIHPTDSSTASTTSHYVFRYDKKHRLSEIINNHYHTEKVHPLASLGAYRVEFSYEENKEIRTFYNPNGKRIANDKGVYKEVYVYNEDNFREQLFFLNIDNKPMESNWNIAEYQWQKTQKFVIERRYNLNKELVDLSPYFPFKITGIIIDKAGVPKGHYNLNEQLKVVDNFFGTASYRDTYDDNGNHVKYTYHDKNERLIMNQWNYAIGKKLYDEHGNMKKLILYNPNDEVIETRNIYSNAKIKLSVAASEKDTLDIQRQSLGYLEALQRLNPELMDKVLNDSLNKITIGYDKNVEKQFGKATTKSQMIEFAKNWNDKGTKFPFNPANEIEILDIYDRIASVKLVSDNWVEYLQLIKLDGNWEIMNIIWQYKDLKKYKK